MSTDDLTAKLGVQMVQSYLKYKDELAKEGIVFDLTKGRAEGEKMGAKVGLGMVKFCPDVLMAIAGDEIYEDEEETPASILPAGFAGVACGLVPSAPPIVAAVPVLQDVCM